MPISWNSIKSKVWGNPSEPAREIPKVGGAALPPVGAGIVPCDRAAEWDGLIKNWKAFAEAARSVGGDSFDFDLAAPASEDEVAQLEAQLGHALPTALRHALRTFSARVYYSWRLPVDFFEDDELLVDVVWGEMEWSLESMAANAPWFCESYPQKLYLQVTGAGNYVAIDLSTPGREPVVYLSHDSTLASGEFAMAQHFSDYLHRSSRIGCAGPDYSLWKPFTSHDSPYLQPDSAIGKRFRQSLGIDW